MKHTMISLCLAAGAVCGVAASGPAEPPPENPYRWDPKVESVTVFKNGLGFFLRRGDAALRDGWCVSGAVPPASFGTLAVYAHGEDETVDIVGCGPGEVVEFDGRDQPDSGDARRARLAASKHLMLQLTYRQDGRERTAAGRLVSVGDDYVVLEAEDNALAVPLDGLLRMQTLEQPLRLHVAADSGKAPERATLGMAYLRKGITWIPEYTLTLRDEQTAELVLRGTLVNEAEDLVHADVNFVVGVPHFLHTDFLAPVAVGQVIRTIGAAVAPREVMSQIMNRAAVATDTRAEGLSVVDQPVPAQTRDLRESTGNLPQWEGAGASDFTVYTRKDLTIRRGEKAIVTLFVKRVRYTHLYRWAPPGDLQHLLVLQNDSDTAWTTGPCLVASEGNALSEDLLKYVPKGGRGELLVTTAINVATDRKEKETERALKAHQPSSNYFLDLVTLDGELMLRNYGDQPADIAVELRLAGRPLTVSDDGAILLDTEKLKLLDRCGVVTWRVTVRPGQSKPLSYRYERYVESR